MGCISDARPPGRPPAQLHSSQVHFRHDIHARPKLTVSVFSGLEHDLYRNSLHDFHVISRGIFGWKQTEKRSGGTSDTVDVPSKGAATRIRRSCVSLKFAVIHTSSSGTTVRSCWPGCTFKPTTTVLFTSPLTGAMILVYCRFSSACSSSARF